jgi:hypothetical protein
MEGNIGSIISALQQADFDERMAALTGTAYAPARGPADDE